MVGIGRMAHRGWRGPRRGVRDQDGAKGMYNLHILCRISTLDELII
jgi:hypothetical protein